MEAVLDSSFIISCIRRKIDFLSELEGRGFKVRVPKEVINEIKDLKVRKGQSREVRDAVDALLDMFEQRKVRKMSLGKGKVDEELVRLGKEGIYIATLDNGIKREVPNRIVILSSKKGIGVERD